MIAERTCAVCRKKADKRALLRFVMDFDDRIIFDQKQNLPGRGAYTHATCKGSKQFQAKLMYSLKKTTAKKK